jgi:hypothetical protein
VYTLPAGTRLWAVCAPDRIWSSTGTVGPMFGKDALLIMKSPSVRCGDEGQLKSLRIIDEWG